MGEDNGGSYNNSLRPVLFGGGDSGGGGASEGWDVATSPRIEAAPSSGGGSRFSDGSLDLDLDEGIWILLALAAVILAIFGAGAY